MVSVKVVEDCMFYCDVWLVLFNEVGGELCWFGVGVVEFYYWVVICVWLWLWFMMILFIYDIKCGEDVCVCIGVLF